MRESTMQYKDYMGTVQYSAEDNVLYGKIIGINDLILFEGESVTELKKAFEEAVEEYLETCKQLGKSPDKTYKGSFNIRISPELHRSAAFRAFQLNISLNDLVSQAIETWLSNLHGQPPSFVPEFGDARFTRFSEESYKAITFIGDEKEVTINSLSET